MRTLAEAVHDYDLAALCPAEDRLYLRDDTELMCVQIGQDSPKNR